ncbi:circularly permuted type 2 ATP-grasp protein [Parafilimonas sp.]|uniref:circularly permuted type 2 ATP-grasp protein n=1 Tax=Parafilimonas sp. TaxID=1969739 RepID=UPI0039E661B7
MTFEPAQVSMEESFFQQHYFDSDAETLSQWKTFFHSFNQLGREEMLSRSNDIARFLKENGVMYNVYGDPSGLHRTWNLDAVPFIINKNEWRKIEAGLIQRAELFNLILKDVYGPQHLIKDGMVPMEIVYGHTGFLRECCNIQYSDKHLLTIYSADMVRGKDGNTWVLNDRTQAPSGFGYTLENRMAMARIVPELFRGLKVRRLSPFFNALRTALNTMAPHQKGQPRIVILTPGPSNETFFEHAFLSTHLGFTLVQGDDLMVKDNFVWLKTLGGLEQVDVIIRRVDDIYCDPLELKTDSQLGIPGLLQAVRCGNVRIANPLGSSVVENPALNPFLHAISRYFLSEDLKLPTIASWWCGQPHELQYVLDNLSSLVIKKIYRDPFVRTSVDGTMLSNKQLQELKEQITAQPHLYVGQEKIDIGSSPAWVKGQVLPCTALFRSFAVSNNETYTVMKGGLTRTSLNKEDMFISNQTGSFSKDTWVLTDQESNPLRINTEYDFLYAQGDNYKSTVLSSRTAENLFWVGRYAERVLGNARFIRTIMQYVEEANNAFIDDDYRLKASLLLSLTRYTHTYPGFEDNEDDKINNPWKELESVLFDAKRIGSLAYNISCFTKAVYAVTGYWSTDTWRVLHEMEDAWQQASAVQYAGHYKMLDVADDIITLMMAFISLNRESISRNQGWELLDAGRKIEQSLSLTSMMQSALLQKQDDAIEYILQEVVLNSNECMMNYRFKYRASIKLPLILELMLLDADNPRSLIYQVERLKNYLSRLPKIYNGHSLMQHEKLSFEAYAEIKLADKDHLSVLNDETQHYRNLENFLKNINALLYKVHNAVSIMYFKHAQTQKQLFH